MILIYAFSNRWATNTSRRVLTELQKQIYNSDIIFLPINSTPQEFFRKHIHYQNYSLIIGLGDGSKYIDKINIETQTKNSYNDQSIYPFSPIKLEISLPPLEDYDRRHFSISSNMGSYNCNYLAYRTELNIQQKKLPTYHLFLHLPIKSNALELATQIHDFLILNHLV